MNVLAQRDLNVVVAGAGGIGSALVRRLLDHYPVARLFVLARRRRLAFEDPRCTSLPIEATEPASVVEAGRTIARECDRLHLVVNTVGVLQAGDFVPEKRLAEVRSEALAHLCAVNAFFLPELASALAPVLRHEGASMLASLSARVGSIADNELGGWYGYRTSKAAHNMLARTLALEWRASHKRTTVVALHPGTVRTPLSEPWIPASYRKRVLTPDESASSMLSLMETLTPAETGRFYAWDGALLPW